MFSIVALNESWSLQYPDFDILLKIRSANITTHGGEMALHGLLTIQNRFKNF